MILAHLIQLDPTVKQRTYFAKACGVARLAYNWALYEWNSQYDVGGRPSELKLRRFFNSVKDEKFPFTKEVTKCAPQHAIMHLGNAFARFFEGQKTGEEIGYPQFKKKGKSRDSFEISNDTFAVNGRRIRIPKLGWVRMEEELRFTGKILSATISRTAVRWFVSITVEVPNLPVSKHSGPVVGIDFGCKNFATLSTGEVIEGPKPHKHLLARLRRFNKSLHRKNPGSKNRVKAQIKLAKLHARIANIRKDFLHKLTTDICRRFSIIGIEDLNVSGMVKTTLARSVLDQSPCEFRRQLTYKAPMHGSTLVVADRWYASSKLCSVCGCKNNNLTLKERTWTCANCGTIHDRDGNASQNLKTTAEQFAGQKPVESIALARDGNRVKLSATKQELNTRDSVGISG